MKSVDLMVAEHINIKRMLDIVRKASLVAMRKGVVSQEDFADMIDFIRNYADKHHHGKEELLFFNRMVKELGTAAEKLVTHGMLVEHDLGRLYISELEQALLSFKDGDEDSLVDIIANAVGYTHLLHRHIHKEDNVVFTFADRNFGEESAKEIDESFDKYETDAHAEGIQDKYIDMLNRLEAKYKR